MDLSLFTVLTFQVVNENAGGKLHRSANYISLYSLKEFLTLSLNLIILESH